MCAAETVTCDLHKSGCILCPHLRLFRLLLPSLLATKLSSKAECFPLHQQCSAWRYSVVGSCSGSWDLISVWERGKRQGEKLLGAGDLHYFYSLWRTAKCLRKCCLLSLFCDLKFKQLLCCVLFFPLQDPCFYWHQSVLEKVLYSPPFA